MLGSADFGAAYDGVSYLCAGEAERQAFLEEPWRYTAQRAPAKLPPPRAAEGAAPLDKLPHIGYCEVHLQRLLVEALAEAGELRPWLPSLSPRDTALKFVALYLKVRAPARARIAAECALLLRPRKSSSDRRPP